MKTEEWQGQAIRRERREALTGLRAMHRMLLTEFPGQAIRRACREALTGQEIPEMAVQRAPQAEMPREAPRAAGPVLPRRLRRVSFIIL